MIGFLIHFPLVHHSPFTICYLLFAISVCLPPGTPYPVKKRHRAPHTAKVLRYWLLVIGYWLFGLVTCRKSLRTPWYSAFPNPAWHLLPTCGTRLWAEAIYLGAWRTVAAEQESGGVRNATEPLEVGRPVVEVIGRKSEQVNQ